LGEIFLHSSDAIFVWVRRCSTSPIADPPGPRRGPSALSHLIRFEDYVQGQVREFMDSLRSEDLERLVPIRHDSSKEYDYSIPVRDVLLHLVEEELQHRGEINALLWQSEIEAPVYDWIDWARELSRLQPTRS
jgi:uncharacterized damage-inducible protein DinB